MKKTPKLFWLWMPIVNCLLLTLGYFVVQLLLSPFAGDWGALGFVLIFLALYSIIIAPLMSIVYCRKIRTMGWTKYLCCLYNAVMIGMYVVIIYSPTKDSILEYLITLIMFIPWYSVFLPSLISGMIKLIVHDVKAYQRKQNNAS